MPWRESSVVEERLKFVMAASRKERAFSELCAEFGISRQTGYTWWKRYQAGGSAQVVDRSRRPLHSPARTAEAVEQAVIQMRRRWPDWGAAKLHALLERQHGGASPVAVRTVHRILERRDLIRDQDRHGAALQRFERSLPNELWQMDFKGPHGSGSRSAVGPLSILDDHSRYVLALTQLGNTQRQGVLATLETTFRQCGLPDQMLMDHGTPWWNPASPWGLTQVAVWIMRQGVRLLYSGIRHPQTQGKVERMHGALQQAARKRHADFLEQTWLDLFRQEYNHVRPHESLGMATPASRWRPSARPFQSAPPDWEYPPDIEVLRLGGDGQLGWRGRRWEISNALRRQSIGLQQAGSRAIVYYCRTPIRELDLATGSSYPIPVDAIGSLQR
jgi:transposase InsO family protein